MNIPFKLKSFREFKNLLSEDVALHLGLSIESYKDLEKGRAKINWEIAQKLSDLYQAPREFFLTDENPLYLQAEVLYNNCTITSGNQGTSGYINNQNNDRGIDEIIYLRKQEVKNLQQQLDYLQEQNDKLLSLLSKQLDRSK